MSVPRAVAIALPAILVVAHATEARADCAGRPTDVGGAAGYAYDAAPVSSYTTARTKVFYATSGPHAPALTSTRADSVPDTVALAGDVAEDALVRYEQMGFKKPLSDAACASNGGDAKLDIYLVKFAGADGTTTRESCTGHACSSWVLSEATFAGRGYANAAEGFRTVVTHELFHAVQNAYDADLDRFWAEGTAQWAMKTLHPELLDLERNLPGFFAQSSRSMDVPPGGAVAEYLYGAAIWPVFLTARYDAALVRAALEHEVDGTASLLAVDAALLERKSALAAEYPLFVAWNACTRDRAGSGGYADAKTYPLIKPAPVEVAGSATGITTGFSNFTYHLAADAASQVTIDGDGKRNGAVLVPFAAGKCEIDKALALPATFQGEALVVVAGVTPKKTDAPFTITVGPAPVDAAPDAGAEGPMASGADAGGASPALTSSGCSVGARSFGGFGGLAAITALVLGLAWCVRRRR